MAEPLLSVQDAEQAAAGLLPRDVRDFVAGGSEAAAYFYYRVLVPKGSGAPDCVPVL